MGEHQSKLLPSDNKFHQGNGSDKKHYWLTPPELYEALNAEFGFTFDPCPYPLPDGFDGLTCEWGDSNYVNPPFGSILHEGKKKGPTAWARKSLAERDKGKDVVLVYPIDKWVLMLLTAGAEVRNLGDVRWLATEDKSQGKGTGRHIACFVLRGTKSLPEPSPREAAIKEMAEALERAIEQIKMDRADFFLSSVTPNTNTVDDEGDRMVLEEYDGIISKASAALSAYRKESEE